MKGWFILASQSSSYSSQSLLAIFGISSLEFCLYVLLFYGKCVEPVNVVKSIPLFNSYS